MTKKTQSGEHYSDDRVEEKIFSNKIVMNDCQVFGIM